MRKVIWGFFLICFGAGYVLASGWILGHALAQLQKQKQEAPTSIQVAPNKALVAWEEEFTKEQIQKSPHCGSERWNIKTLNSEEGKQLAYALAVPSTVKELVAKKAPSESYLRNLENERVLPDEQIVYRLDADVLGYKLESDSDYHIVIADHGTKSPTMIAEIPAGACSPMWIAPFFNKERSLFMKDFGRPVAAFHRLSVPKRATVTGVFFFDFLHGQIGVAPNGAELHPALEIALR